jgi:uncharacterized protein YuzE
MTTVTTDSTKSKTAAAPELRVAATPPFRYAAHGHVTLQYAPSIDALTILYAGGQALHTADLGGERYMDYSDDGRILAVEVLGAGRGVDLDGIPSAADVAAALAELGLPAAPA